MAQDHMIDITRVAGTGPEKNHAGKTSNVRLKPRKKLHAKEKKHPLPLPMEAER